MANASLNDDARPPGVYFDFVERPAPRQRRRSDVAGFVGLTAPSPGERSRLLQCTDEEQRRALLLQVRRCDRLADFYGPFDKAPKDIREPLAMPMEKDARDPYFVPRQQSYLEGAVRGFFANGGQTCFVAPSATPTADKLEDAQKELVDGFKTALGQLSSIDAVSFIVAPGTGDLLKPHAAEVWREMILQAETLRDRTALLDPPANFKPQDIREELPRSPSGLAAIYWPWLKVADERPDVRTRNAPVRVVPPCGHIAGTIARRDLSRGVFAPPANMMIEGALGVTQELLPTVRHNVNENGINVIVATSGRGVRAMGARTLLADNNDPYRWLNVRRLVAHLAEWIAEDTQWTVFEPQGEVVYRAIERTVRTLLFGLWRDGGLVGETDDEAYFVRCDATTNPPEEAEQGRLICIVGIRPAVPAEMIVVRIGIAEGRVELIDREFADA